MAYRSRLQQRVADVTGYREPWVLASILSDAPQEDEGEAPDLRRFHDMEELRYDH